MEINPILSKFLLVMVFNYNNRKQIRTYELTGDGERFVGIQGGREGRPGQHGRMTSPGENGTRVQKMSQRLLPLDRATILDIWSNPQ